MDNLTHSLVGVALSRVYFKNRVALATTAMVVAANLPDLDQLYAWPGIRYLEFHRGIMHSFVALPLLALAVAWGLRWACRRWHKPVPGWGIAWLLAAVGLCSHLLVDWTTWYGIRLFAPLSEQWYGLNWMPTYDPWVWLILAAFLGFPMMLGLILTEVRAGAERKANRHAISATMALLLLAGWMGLRGRQHAAALSLLNSPNVSGMYDGQLPLDWEAYPSVGDPNSWQAVVNLPSNYLMVAVDTNWNTDYGYVHLQRNYIKPPRTPAMAAAEGTRTGGIFLWFARFPLVDEQTDGDGAIINFADLRFGHAQVRPEMHAQVFVDGSGQVVRQSFSWTR